MPAGAAGEADHEATAGEEGVPLGMRTVLPLRLWAVARWMRVARPKVEDFILVIMEVMGGVVSGWLSLPPGVCRVFVLRLRMNRVILW